MADLINLFSNNSTATLILAVAIGVFLISLVVMFISAFRQGREISFWPPSIGLKPTEEDDKTKKNHIGKNDGIIKLLINYDNKNRFEELEDLISKATIVRMCGWSLVTVISKNRHKLRDLVQQGHDLRIILLDPESDAVKALDSIVTGTDALNRKRQNWPEVTSTNLTRNHIYEVLEILKNNNISKTSGEIIRVCNSILPMGIVMLEFQDGSGWLSVQIYPLHPDIRSDKRLNFVITDREADIFQKIREQFDVAWEDPNFSYPIATLMAKASGK